MSITVTTTRSEKEIEFEVSKAQESYVNTKDFRMQQEWKIYEFLNTSKRNYVDIFRKYERPALSFQA